MKNTNKIPSEYDKAIKSGKVEFATTNGSGSRSHLIAFINVIKAMEMRGILIPTGEALDYEGLMKQVESKKINIPEQPFDKLSKKEQRSFSDTLTGIKIPNITDDMNARQRELYDEHMHYKNGDTKDFRGNWIKAKK